MKKSIKIISLFLTLLMLAGIVCAAPFTASAADSTESSGVGANSIWFKVNPDIFKNYAGFSCYIYRRDGVDVLTGAGKKLNQWGARACNMEDAGDGYFYYDFDANGVEIEPGVTYAAIFAMRVSSYWGIQTNDIIFGKPVFGKEHAAWCDGQTVENSVDSNKRSYSVEWTGDFDKTKYGEPLVITSIGNITGYAIPEGETTYSLFVNFLSDPGAAGIQNALNYNGKTCQQTVDDVATDKRFNLNQTQIASAVKEAQAKLRAYGSSFVIKWDPSKSTASGGKLATPHIDEYESVSVNGGIKLVWNAVAKAEMYRVYYKDGGKWVKLADTDKNTYTDKTVKVNESRTYTVKCITKAGKSASSYDAAGTMFTYLVPVLVSAQSVSNGIKVTWKGFVGGYFYRVFRKDNNKWVKVGDSADPSFVDTAVTSGKTYTYTVRTFDLERYTSGYDAKGVTATYIAAPKLKKAASAVNGVTISWNASAGASKYRVFYKASGSWKRLGDTTGTSYTDKNVSSGYSYTYTVRALSADGKSYVSAYDTKGVTVKYIAAPKISKAQSVSNGVKLTWGKVNGAEKYRVFYKNSSGKWVRLGDSTANTYTDKTIKKGATRTYTVRCISGDGKTYTSAYRTDGKTVTFK